MNINAIVTFIYALLLFVGGTIGYATAHSIPSLAMGAIFALLLSISAWGMYRNCNYSYYSALILTVILLGFFTYRLVMTYKVFPPGVMAVVSLAVFLVLLFNPRKS